MSRLQNLSGSNFDATPQRNLLSLYELPEAPSAESQQALRDREAAAQEDAARQAHLASIKRAAEQAAREQRQRRLAESAVDEEQVDPHRSFTRPSDRRPRRRSSDALSHHEQHVVLQLDDDDEEDDGEEEHALHDPELGMGTGRIHLHGQLRDEPDEELELTDLNLGDDTGFASSYRR